MESQFSLADGPRTAAWPDALQARDAIATWIQEHPGVAVVRCVVLEGPFINHDGLSWNAPLPELEAWSDGPEALRSQVVLFEAGQPLGPAHATHSGIAQGGRGAYSHFESRMYFSTRDGSSPLENGRQYVAVQFEWRVERGSTAEVRLPSLFWRGHGNLWRALLPGTAGWSDIERIRPSSLQLLEDGRLLGPGNCIVHRRIEGEGGGAYVHWGEELMFSTSDGSDPNTNGRRYTVRARPPVSTDESVRVRSEYLDRYYTKRELQFHDPHAVWRLSPDWEYYLAMGGDAIAPPSYANIVGLTSFCNLKCTICGSQEAIDYEGVPRRTMKPEVMAAVADTIFPFLSVVILASLGEPTIYPWFNQVLEKAHQWGCSIKLESNATALTPRMIDLLTAVKGELFFSIDATGDLFETVRRGASWAKVRANLESLMAKRDPELTRMNMYPTISRRTLPDMMNVLMVAVDLGFDEITFHSYDPTMFAQEERPTPEEFAPKMREITDWCEAHAGRRDLTGLSIKVNGQETNPFFEPPLPLRSLPLNHPVSRAEYERNVWRCRAPLQNVDIGPDGQIYPCVWSGARPQDNTMGYAISRERFADAWLGKRYRELREALRHDSTKPINVAQCSVCLQRYA